MNKINKYKTNEKIILYKENLIKFIECQKNKVIHTNMINEIDYVVGILFLTETNRYCKINKITIHGYYLAYTFINLFNGLRKRMFSNYCFDIKDYEHYIMSLASNIDYLNSRVDSTNSIKNKINNDLSKFILGISPILYNIFDFKKNHEYVDEFYTDNKQCASISSSTSLQTSVSKKNSTNIDLVEQKIKNNNINNDIVCDDKNNKIMNKEKYCNEECYDCCVNNVLSKFFYILLQTAKFLGTGSYNDPNLHRLSVYYANIFYTSLKSDDIEFIKNNSTNNTIYTEFYENYLTYKNKLNYSLIELELNSETLDEIIIFLDNHITENLSINIK
jgi:hypothetical protein